MSAMEVRNVLGSLAQSQGFYGRLINRIDESDDSDDIYWVLGEGCSSALDLVLKI